VLNQRSGQYFYAHAFNILSCSAFLLVQIQNRLYSISSLPLKAGPVRACRASLASSYTYGISIVIACLVGMYPSLIFSCTKLCTIVFMSSM
jgi:hypothetical protein